MLFALGFICAMLLAITTLLFELLLQARKNTSVTEQLANVVDLVAPTKGIVVEPDTVMEQVEAWVSGTGYTSKAYEDELPKL